MFLWNCSKSTPNHLKVTRLASFLPSRDSFGSGQFENYKIPIALTVNKKRLYRLGLHLSNIYWFSIKILANCTFD